MNKKLLLFFLCASFFLLLQACSSRKVTSDVSLPPDISAQLPVEQQIATFIGNAYEGASETFMNTRYGTATVTVGRSYHSALNMPCKEAWIQGSQRSRVAACQDSKKGWILAPDILGDGAL
ncbi:MAG: hypothetical protein J5803_00770 [Desulfovibrio sp.]|nr:hypothetical protein [Desulfovibrio sp.]